MQDFIYVDSSNIEAIAYEKEQQAFFVLYRTGGVYKYKNVPAETYSKFLKADSKGKFINNEIKPNYPYEKLEKK